MRDVADILKQKKNERVARLIYLYQIKYDEVGNNYLRYTNYGKPIEYNGQVFEPYVISHDRIDEDLSGNPISVSLKIANVNRNIQAILSNYGLIEKEVKIIMVCEEDISDPQAYSEDTFRVVDCNASVQEVTCRLSSPFDAMDVRIPRRYFFRGYCRFRFKDSNCQYVGDAGDCEKTLQRCRQLENTLHFGAFPATPDKQMWLR